MLDFFAVRIKKFFLDPTSLALLAIVLLGSFLRFWNLGNTPLWYSDEGVNMNIAWNLAFGRMQFSAVTYTFVPHTPLFYLICAGAIRIFGYSIIVARSLTALYGILSIVVLFFLGCELGNKKVGLTASLLFSIFPLAVLYNRWDFDYNLLQLLSIFTLFSAVKYLKTHDRKWFYLTSISAGLAALSSLLGLGLIAGLFVLVIVDKNIKKTLQAVLIASGIFAAYVLSMLALQWTAFVFDFNNLVSNTGHSGISFLANGENLILYSPWITLGFIGLLVYPIFYKRYKESTLLLGFFFCLFLFTAAFFTIYGPQIHGIIQLFPFFSLGIAFGVWTAINAVLEPVQNRIYKIVKASRTKKFAIGSLWLCALLVLSIPLSLIVYSDFNSTLTGFQTELDGLCDSPAGANALATYINAHTNSSDIVLCSAQIAWLFNCKTADLLAAGAIQHEPVPFYPDPMPNNRFVFNCSYQNAKFFIVDNFTRNWEFPIACLNATISYMLDNWSQAFQTGEYTVYQNPDFS